MHPLLPGHDVVHFIDDYYDGILGGVADLAGKPHDFRLDGGTEGDETYRLVPMPSEVFEAAVELQQMWFRSVTAFRNGRFAGRSAPPPCLPDDEERHPRLEAVVSAWRSSSVERGLTAKGDFEPLGARTTALEALGALQVRWRVVTTDPGGV